MHSVAMSIAGIKERPILFNAKMVRAILDGRKTQTRRLIKPAPKYISEDHPGIGSHFWDFGWAYFFDSGTVHTFDQDGIGGANWNAERYPDEDRYSEAYLSALDQDFIDKPKWVPGGHLWVRETFTIAHKNCWGEPKVISPDNAELAAYFKAGWDRSEPKPWKPSIHMPRWASRITLEITNVRVERLNDISEEDAKAEGVSPCSAPECENEGLSHSHAFINHWDSIHGKGAWIKTNPWVWVIEFKRVKP